MFTLRCCKSDIVVIYDHHCNFSSRVVDMGMQLASGVNDTCGQFATDIKGSHWYILRREYFWDFTYSELTLLELLVIWERWYMKKTWSKKSCDTVLCHLNPLAYLNKFAFNPIIHTVWLDNHALTLKSNSAKYYFHEKSRFLHTFLKFCCESRKTKVKFKNILLSVQ